MTTPDGSPATPERHGVGVALDGRADAVGAWVEANLHPERSAIDLLLPFVHRKQPASDTPWSAYVLCLTADGRAEPLAEAIADRSLPLVRRVDLLRLQPGLDLFQPVSGSRSEERRMQQLLEYVDSDPASRAHYYETQYRFSGPAVRRLHERNRFGRFIGCEVERVVAADSAMPAWDVVHVTGLTIPQRIRSLPHYHRAFNAAARAIGEPSGKAVIGRWATQRTRTDVPVTQLWDQTLPA
ncbi:MAG: hypothetical protein AAGA93_17600 [Actinomycetota bacterium]